jgi:hypothetical protein
VELGHLHQLSHVRHKMRSVLRGQLATPIKPCVEVLTTQRRSYPAYKEAKKVKRFHQAKCHLKVSSLKDHDMTLPARMKNLFKDIPAYDKWITRTSQSLDNFQPNKVKKKQTACARMEMENLKKVELNKEYLAQFGDTPVTLELTNRDRLDRWEFERYQGTFSEILAYMDKDTKWDSVPRLYLAQQPLDDLPKELQDDLSPPEEIIKIFGKGDIYASSLWMGKAPTHTPLHRDPNPNIFIQLAGRKTIRMMRPDVGRKMYEEVRAKLTYKVAEGANMRGEEMMQGEEFDKLRAAVWNDQKATDTSRLGFEVELKPGHGLYIPLGWWHAVQGTGTGPNISVSHEVRCET